MTKRDDYGLNFWQRLIVLLFLRLPPGMDRFMRRSNHYQEILLDYYARHRNEIPCGDWTLFDAVCLIGEVAGGIVLVALLYLIFLMVCACTDYNWVPIK